MVSLHYTPLSKAAIATTMLALQQSSKFAEFATSMTTWANANFDMTGLSLNGAYLGLSYRSDKLVHIRPECRVRRLGVLAGCSKGGDMAFDRLQKLGEAKFQRIVNELMRGTSAQHPLLPTSGLFTSTGRRRRTLRRIWTSGPCRLFCRSPCRRQPQSSRIAGRQLDK